MEWGEILTEVLKFGRLNGKEVFLIKITNSSGAFVTISNYGCTITSICVPDKNGKLTDVCLGYETLDEYVENDGYLGMFVGRCANRIAGGRFSLNGTEYCLKTNNGANHLHGGEKGFSSKVFDFSIKGNTVKFTAVSEDGEEGYPGRMTLEVSYSFTNANELVLDYRAVSSKDTIINLTNHAYFDLNGQGSGFAMEQKAMIFSEGITEINENLIPTGNIIQPEKDSPFDFSRIKPLGKDIGADDSQLITANGYDHNFVISEDYSTDYGIYGLKKAAYLVGGITSIAMEVLTTQLGMQMYTANFLSERKGKNGRRYSENSGVALETQNFPDAVNHKNFPSPVLKEGEIYSQTTIYKFSISDILM